MVSPSFPSSPATQSAALPSPQSQRLQPPGWGDPAACPGKTKKDPSFAEIVEEEMKGAEDLIPQLEESSSEDAKGSDDTGATQSPPAPVVSRERSRP